MSKCSLTAVVLCVISALCMGFATAAEPVSSSALTAAEQSLETYKRFIPWEDFGFSSHQELLDARVEGGIPVYRLDLSTAAEGVETMAGAIRDMKMEVFVVSSNGRPVSRLTLRQVETGEYKRHGFGGSGEHLQRGLSALPSQSDAKLVQLGPAEFLYLNHEGTEYLVYIDTIRLHSMEPFKLYTFADAQPVLQKFARGQLGYAPVDAPAPPPAVLWTLAAVGGLLIFRFARAIWRLAQK